MDFYFQRAADADQNFKNDKTSSPLTSSLAQRLELLPLRPSSRIILNLRRNVVTKEGETPQEAAWGGNKWNSEVTFQDLGGNHKEPG